MVETTGSELSMDWGTAAVQLIETWFNANSKKISSFWIGANWRMWARYEIFVALEEAYGKDCLVTHGNDEIYKTGHDEADIYLEPRQGEAQPVAILLCCERVSENAGSWERFAEKFEADWKTLVDLCNAHKVEDKVYCVQVGFSGQATQSTWTEEPVPHLRKEAHGVCMWTRALSSS